MKIRRCIVACLIATAFTGSALYYGWHELNDGFSTYGITSTLPAFPQFAVDVPAEKKTELQDLINQSFHYIGKGCQFYVFESKDKKCVIKFFKHKHLHPYAWTTSLYLPAKLKRVLEAKRDRRFQRVHTLFSSCIIAYEELPEESGLFFIHLNRLPALKREITLFDKLGFKHKVSIDDHEFILQKKGISPQQVFVQECQNDALMRERIQQLIHLVIARCEKGVADLDAAFVQNIAYSDEGAIFVDIGQFYKNFEMQNWESQEREVAQRLDELSGWCHQHFPHLVPLIEEEYAKWCSAHDEQLAG